ADRVEKRRAEARDAAARVSGRRCRARHRRARESARLRHRRCAAEEPDLSERLCGRRRRRHPAGRDDSGSDRRTEDRLHDRIDGRRHRAEHCRGARRRAGDRHGHLECDLPRGYGRYGDRIRRVAANAAAQRHVDEEGQMGPRCEDRVREVLPAQGSARGGGDGLRAVCSEGARHRAVGLVMRTTTRYARGAVRAAMALLAAVPLAASAETLDDAWRIALEQDLSLLAAASRVAAAEADVDAARAERKPIVSANVNALELDRTPSFDFSGAGLPIEMPLLDGSRLVLAGTSVTLPLYTAGRIGAGVRAAEA